ncbi:hypothetical protein GIB67_040021 [Kingdonia uniflora]|uniref:Uncharacterized protein n=1 Tax=Kingdonia uniflora TaxID=39325 RepID=A0A7J7MUL0_9MAGN|nr:hypothetical protein GIB67_040021 [Kingdonia uniflora]
MIDYEMRMTILEYRLWNSRTNSGGLSYLRLLLRLHQLPVNTSHHADVCFRKFSDKVAHCTTLNEPNILGSHTYALFNTYTSTAAALYKEKYQIVAAFAVEDNIKQKVYTQEGKISRLYGWGTHESPKRVFDAVLFTNEFKFIEPRLTYGTIAGRLKKRENPFVEEAYQRVALDQQN